MRERGSGISASSFSAGALSADEGQVLDGFRVLGRGLGAEGSGPRPSAGDFQCSGRGRALSPPGFPEVDRGFVEADRCVGPDAVLCGTHSRADT